MLLAAALCAGAPGPASGQEILEREIVSRELGFDSAAHLRRLLNQGQASLKAGRPAAAAESATQAIEHQGELTPAQARAFRAEALELRARAYLALDRELEARADVAALMSGGWRPGASQDDPFSMLVEQVRQSIFAELEVTSAPELASVSIDGEAAGTTPLGPRAVPAGRHSLRVEHPGYAPSFASLELAPGESRKEHFALERSGAILVVMTDSDGVTVTVDGEPRGVTARPSQAEAELLSKRYGSPIAAQNPPAIAVVSPLAPGLHKLELSGPCRRPRASYYPIEDAGSHFEIASLEPLHGGLSIELEPGLEGARVRVDGGAPGTPPLLVEGLCPGRHRVELDLPGDAGPGLARSVLVAGDATARVTVARAPVLAFLPGRLAGPEDAALEAALMELRRWNPVVLETPVPSADLLRAGQLNLKLRDMLVYAARAALLAWTRMGPEGPELCLVAAGSARPECAALGADQAPELAARIDRLPARAIAHLGLSAYSDRAAGLTLVAVREAGPAARAGLKVGDRLLAVDGEPLVAELAELEARLVPRSPVTIRFERDGAELSRSIEPEAARLEWPLAGVFANALLARLDAEQAWGATIDPLGEAIERTRLLLALGDPEAALEAGRGIEGSQGWGVGAGTLLYYRGLAALACGKREQAAELWRAALQWPDARALGPHGPRLSPALQTLLRRSLGSGASRLGAGGSAEAPDRASALGEAPR